MDFAAAAAYNPDKQPQRPYVQFEFRPMENRAAKLADGQERFTDVAWAIVRAPGSKDSVEKVAEDWLTQLDAYARDQRIPPQWPSEYRNAFELWKRGEEVPVTGTAIKTWSAPTPAQRKSILAAGVLTVEDLAVANEQILGALGMNAHMLKRMAQSWLEEAKNKGATAAQLADAMLKLESQAETIKNQANAIQSMQAQLTALTKK